MSATVERNIITADPGPIARFNHVIAQPDTMQIIVQRVTDGEALKDIARAWKIPYGKLAEWIVEDRERSEAYNQARRLWVDTLAQETVAIADDAEPDQASVQKAKLRIDTRLKLAAKLDRERYGDSSEVKHTGAVSLIAVLSGLPRGTKPALEEKIVSPVQGEAI